MSTQSIRDLRSNFDRIKRELDAAMLLCMPAYDQYRKVMLSLSELLCEALESVKRRKVFKFDALPSIFDLMDSWPRPETSEEAVLNNFSRAFVLFIDALSGLIIHEEEVTTRDSRLKVIPREKTRVPGRKTYQQSASSVSTTAKRVCVPTPQPDPDVLISTGVMPRPIPIKSEFPDYPSLDGPDSDDLMAFTKLEEEPGTSWRSNELIRNTPPSHSEGTSLVKEEAVYQDYDNWNSMPSSSGHSRFKEELIKEEPIEEPIADSIRIGATSFPVRRKEVTVHHDIPMCSSSMPDDRIVVTPSSGACPYCGVDCINQERHIQINHKSKWLRHVTKCPEDECDFRSSDINIVNQHHEAMHHDKYRKWRSTMKEFFLTLTRCAFCARYIKNFAQFVEHMEKEHPRLATYEIPILKCNSCPFTSHRCHLMLKHWFENSTKCGKFGVCFIHQTAAKITVMDREQKSDEVRLAPSPPPRSPHPQRMTGNRR